MTILRAIIFDFDGVIADTEPLHYAGLQRTLAETGITLTERTKGVPMAGVPFHAAEGYLRRLVEQGFRVAVCEQVQDPKEAKGVAVLVAGSVALMNLYRTAQPLNRLRLALVVTMSALFALAFVVPSSRRLFDLPVTEWWAYLVAAAFIVAAYPLLVLGSWVSERIHPSTRLVRHD